MAKSDNRTGALGAESRLWNAADLLPSNMAPSEYGTVVPGLISLKYIERFPDEFMFQLAKAEFEDWKSQIVISNKELMGNSSYTLLGMKFI